MPQDATTILNYFHPDSGYEHRAGTVGEKRRQTIPVETTIKDMRGHLDDFTLDNQGFQLITHESDEKTFDDDARIRDSYYKECAELVRKVVGATTAVTTGHVVRKASSRSVKESEKDMPDDARSNAPSTAQLVHVDLSYDGAYERMGGLFPNEAEKMTRCRWAVINVWRPMKPVTREPLAMSDASSMEDSELVEIRMIFPQKPASTEKDEEKDKENRAPNVDYYSQKKRVDVGMWQAHAPSKPDQHKWYYASDMQPNEALLLKIFDSKKSGVARRSAHTAFYSALDHGPVRESLDVKVLVFWEDQDSD